MQDYEFVSLETDRRLGPVAIARKVHEYVQNKENFKLSTELASIKIEYNPFGGFEFGLGFHQSIVKNPFVFHANMAEMEPIGNSTAKATNIEELNQDLGLLANLIKEAYNTNPWEFAKLDAASIGGTGALTDYEFLYETGTLKDSIISDDMENAIVELV